jgi:transcriptional regulator with XRE-family HTH domain
MSEKQLPPLAVRLKTLREAKGLSQMELAVLAKLSLSAVYQIEQGLKTDVRASTLKAIADVLGVTMDELFREPEVVVDCHQAAEPAEEKKPARRGRKRKDKEQQ